MKRVTADTNVIVSALQFGGKPLEFLQLAALRDIELAVSDAILEETFRILRTKFGWSRARIGEADMFLRAITTHVTPTEALDAVPRDVTDNRILECAVAHGSEAIVTGDADILSLKAFRRMSIHRVADFLAEFQSRGG